MIDLMSSSKLVDVVVPIFNGGSVVRRCIESVLASRHGTPFEVVAVDDASTEQDVVIYLDALAADGKITLLRNTENQGFVRTANRGMCLHPERDVVLLNSDTEVANDWLDRLCACADSRSDVGTVTPFSNNATICSFPVFCADNPLPIEVDDVAELDGLFAELNAGQSVVIPTAVGFCMYILRQCIEQIGLFDEVNFGRGYGEENDFCRRAIKAGWRNLLCADVFVFHEGSASFGSEREELIKRSEPLLSAMHPDYLDEVRAFIRHDPVAPLRRVVEIELARRRQAARRPALPSAPVGNLVDAAFTCRSPQAMPSLSAVGNRPVQLHVLHDLGGGVERWCRDYCRADTARVNLVLKPFCRGHAAGEGLMLFADIDDAEPIGLWLFATPFEVTAINHPEYAKVFRAIVAQYAVGAVLVSSLIGHTLDALVTGLPTVFIAHDYFPACPAINLYYDGVCQQCDDDRLTDCLQNNPDFNPFLLFSAEERLAVRKGFLEIIGSGSVTVVVPCRIVWQHLQCLFPEIDRASWVTIPHGVDDALTPLHYPVLAKEEKLRVVVLGMLSVNKGMRLLGEALDKLADFAEIHLVGAMEVGEMFIDRPGVHVVSRYALDELQEVLQGIRPDVGMLLSIWPETFSYTLTELICMGVPPLATRLGGFAERLIDGETGFLIDPTAEALVARLRELDANRDLLARVRANLAGLPRRNAADMVADYHRLLPLTGASIPVTNAGAGGEAGPGDVLGIRQAVALTSMWKHIKSLDLQLTMSREARPRLQGPGQIAENQRRTAERQLAIAENQRAIAEHQRTVAEHQRAVAEIQFEHERQRLHEQIKRVLATQTELRESLAERHAHVHALEVQLDSLHRQIQDIFSTTSWRLSRPIRTVGTLVRRIRKMASLTRGLLADPPTIPQHVSMLHKAWRTGGLLAFKAHVRNLEAALAHQNAWGVFRQTFQCEVAPRIVQAIAVMPTRPLISVIVPTYNTQQTMLAEMLDSVVGQLYGHWELCVADDCSTEPHVAATLRDYAQRDARIKLHFSAENRGVAHASNRALDLVTGEFVVLLDHDDILEPQALFRVAQAVVAENPDMLYSDEIMVSLNRKKVLQYALRPAFSLEFLRAHPYFVHLVGFRTRLLREVGGFDEALTISQDYDLMLRVAERAQVVTHVPEILYQWRIHAGSSGTRKMDEVMATSKAILRRHLERCGEKGEVSDGARFNLFDVRYPLVERARVAIVIPTKNHGELVRQCVESIRATVESVDYEIVIIDHESDDPDTLSYLESIGNIVRVLRYSGPFNFSAINNWAIRELDGDYTHYLLCNNDIEAIHPGWLERMLELGQHKDVGIVGAQLLYPDGETIQHAGVCVGAFGAAEHYAKFIRVPDIPLYLGFSEILSSTHEVSAVTAACLLIRRDAFAAVGGFDEKLAVGFGDVDLCLRVGQRGYRILQCPHAELLHHESFTRGKTTGMDPHPADSALFQARWAEFLRDGDPYFHPGLNQNSTAWQMRQPIPCAFATLRRIVRRDMASGRQSITFNS